MAPAEIRAACRKYAEKYVELQRQDFKRLGVFGRWDDPYLTMSAEYQAVIAGAFVEFLDRGYVYKGLKPVNWCIYRPHRAGRGRSRIREPHQPVHLGALRADIGPGEDRSRARRAQSLRPHLDHHALDHPGQHGHRLPSEVRVRPRWMWTGDVYIVAAELLKVTAEKCGWSGHAVLARFPGDEAGARRLPPSVPGARFARHPGRPRHARAGHRRGPHRARARPGGLRGRAAVRHRDLLPGGRARAASITPRAPRARCPKN